MDCKEAEKYTVFELKILKDGEEKIYVGRTSFPPERYLSILCSHSRHLYDCSTELLKCLHKVYKKNLNIETLHNNLRLEEAEKEVEKLRKEFGTDITHW